MTDAIGAAPETRNPHFIALLFGACAAPLFWLGQVMLGYGITAYACYPGDHPVLLSYGGMLRNAVIGFDVVAMIAAFAGGIAAFWCLRGVPSGGLGRNRFLAIWGVFSSLWFFAAILFNTIASLTVPLCVQ